MDRRCAATLFAASLTAAVGLVATVPAAAQGEVTVYCSILEEQCREGATMFERSTGIKVAMVRKSTGEVYAQVKAEAGNPRGVSNLAAVSGGASADPARGRALLAKAAETNPEAQYQLGMMLAEGSGGPKDEAGARGLFEKASAQNHAAALERMGAFAQSGVGGPQDKTAAKAYYERAVALGNDDAKAALKRLECPYVLKDKRGNVVSNLCF